jgi:hypothetical protein
MWSTAPLKILFLTIRAVLLIALFLAVLVVIQHQPKQHQTYCLRADFTPHQREMLHQAFSVWDYRSPTPRFTEDCTNSYAIQVKFANPQEHQYWSDYFDKSGFDTASVFDPSTNSIIVMRDRVKSDEELRVMVAHEAGHAALLPDLQVFRPAIMSGVLQQQVIDEFRLYPDDIEALCHVQPCQ